MGEFRMEGERIVGKVSPVPVAQYTPKGVLTRGSASADVSGNVPGYLIPPQLLVLPGFGSAPALRPPDPIGGGHDDTWIADVFTGLLTQDATTLRIAKSKLKRAAHYLEKPCLF